MAQLLIPPAFLSYGQPLSNQGLFLVEPKQGPRILTWHSFLSIAPDGLLMLNGRLSGQRLFTVLFVTHATQPNPYCWWNVAKKAHYSHWPKTPVNAESSHELVGLNKCSTSTAKIAAAAPYIHIRCSMTLQRLTLRWGHFAPWIWPGLMTHCGQQNAWGRTMWQLLAWASKGLELFCCL